MPEMPIYYIIIFEELTPCYLIKEGYIPCRDYRENKNDKYYWSSYSREDFCIADPSETENIFENKTEAIQVLIKNIEENFLKAITNLTEKRNKIITELQLEFKRSKDA